MVETLKVVLEFAANCLWPIFATYVIWLFKDEIAKRIKDIKRVSPTGIDLNLANAQENAPPPQINPPVLQGPQADPPVLPEPHPYGLMQTVFGLIMQEVANLPEAEKVPRLAGMLAESRMIQSFERTWGIMFQSQIDALQLLQRNNSRVTLAAARTFFAEQVTPRDPALFTDFDVWLRYPLTQNLVRIEGGDVVLTTLGSDFLTFLLTNKAGLLRAG